MEQGQSVRFVHPLSGQRLSSNSWLSGILSPMETITRKPYETDLTDVVFVDGLVLAWGVWLVVWVSRVDRAGFSLARGVGVLGGIGVVRVRRWGCVGCGWCMRWGVCWRRVRGCWMGVVLVYGTGVVGVRVCCCWG
jgi:hypothetical protein